MTINIVCKGSNFSYLIPNSAIHNKPDKNKVPLQKGAYMRYLRINVSRIIILYIR